MKKQDSHKPTTPRRMSGNGISRRTVMQGIGAAAATPIALYAPYVHAATKKIRFLNGEPSAASARAMRMAAAQYEKETGIVVEVDSVPGGKEFEKLQASIQSGMPYDIGTLSFIGDVLLLANAKKLVPLNHLISQYHWGPKILFPMKGNYYWYPYDYNFCWINFRKDLYAANGLSAPKTWGDFTTNLSHVVGKGKNQLPHGIVQPIGSNGATSYTAFGYMWANGVKLFDDHWNVVLDSPEILPRAAEYLDFMAGLTRYMPPSPMQAGWPALVGDFEGGVTSHTPGTGRLIDQMNTTMPARAREVSSFLFPSKRGDKFAVNHGYDGWVVLDTPMAEEAIKYLKWFGDNQLINFLHTSAMNYQPTRLDIYDNPKWKNYPMYKTFAHIVAMQKEVLHDPNIIIRSIDTEGPEPDVRAGKVFRSYAMPEMLQDRIVNGKSAEESVKIAAAKIRKVIAS